MLLASVALVSFERGGWDEVTEEQASRAAGGEEGRPFPGDDMKISLLSGRRKLVILGSGWGAVSVVSHLKPGLYDVTVVSPRNYHLFTPLLPSVAVGTVEPRTIAEPIREVLSKYGHVQSLASTQRSRARFYEATATGVDFEKGLVHCRDGSEVSADDFSVPFDALVIAVGSATNTFNIPGVREHCMFLKDIEDAKRLRDRIGDCLETAALPSVSPEERRRLLSFVIAGGGPTGVEIAAEINDFIEEDAARYFPREIVDAVSVRVIQSGSHVLNTYDAAISAITESHFSRLGIDVARNARVVAVEPSVLSVRHRDPDRVERIPFGLCVWTTGVSPVPLTRVIQAQFPSQQTNRNCLLTSPQLQLVLPVPHQRVFAIGDCASPVQSDFLSQAERLFTQFDVNHDGSLELSEFHACMQQLVTARPDKQYLVANILSSFAQADLDGDGVVSLPEFRSLLTFVDNNATSFPATAQVAHQEGCYVASLLNAPNAPPSEAPPFEYHHFGSFAYVGGDSAVLDLSGASPALKFFGSTFGGKASMLLWRASYWNMQLSWRNKLALAGDWTRTKCFGRDISRL